VVKKIAFLAIVAVLSFSPSGVATPQPVPTQSVVPIITNQFAHVLTYRGDFTFDETDYGPHGATMHAHWDATLHRTQCGPDMDHINWCDWRANFSDGLIHAEETGCENGSSGYAGPDGMLVGLNLDFLHGQYAVNINPVKVKCSASNGQDYPPVGGFNVHYALPSYNSPMCGTMKIVAAGDFEQIGRWNFVPVTDNHAPIVLPKGGCPQVQPPPQTEQ
jgi:hypothetical protein